MIKPELLAPAGSPEHFQAAVENGADAVYFGGKVFNARQYAQNFTHEQMADSIKYAHSKKVKAYMTLNTLVKQNELREAVNQAAEGIDAGVDCFIVQDMGLAALLKREFPETPLHLSTQGTTYDLAGLKFAKKMGFKRVVLAREMSLNQICECTEYAKNNSIETEIFVHGALCMCLSGQCSMSCLIGGRSGNRGSCAQPCRKRYTLEDFEGERLGEPGFILSPKDISYLSELDEIINSGVNSLKIEGRLKSPEYTAATVQVFRKYIDRVCETSEKVLAEKSDIEKLEQVFSRGGFSKGYLYGKQNGALLSGESPKHRGLFLGTVRKVKQSAVNRDKKIIEVDLKRDISVGDGIEIIGKGFPGGIVTYLSGKNGNVKTALAGEKVKLGDIPGSIKPGELVYKVSDKKLLKQIRDTYADIKPEKEKISGSFYAKKGSVLVYEVVAEDGSRARASGSIIIEEAESAPTSKDSVLEKLSKTGNTPYVLGKCDIKIEGNLMIPMSEVNKVRREALEKLQNGKK